MICFRKMREKHLWKGDIFREILGHWPETLLKMSLFHRCFPCILLKKVIYLFSIKIDPQIGKG